MNWCFPHVPEARLAYPHFLSQSVNDDSTNIHPFYPFFFQSKLAPSQEAAATAELSSALSWMQGQ